MHFFGYIPSLVLAIGLLVFYMGNLTQSLIVKIKEENQSLKEIQMQDKQIGSPSYFSFDTYAQLADKYDNNKSKDYHQAVVKGFSEIALLTERDVKLKAQPPFLHINNKYSSTLFSRPPPQMI